MLGYCPRTYSENSFPEPNTARVRLVSKLYDHTDSKAGTSGDTSTSQNERIRHVAIAPWFPLLGSAIASASWTIFPMMTTKSVKFEDERDANSILRVSPSSAALQVFGYALRTVLPTKLNTAGTTPIEIRMLDVIPVPLDTVFVKVDREVTEKLESGELDPRQFWEYKDDQSSVSTGFASNIPRVNGHEITKARRQAKELVRGVVRRALQESKVIHLGAALPLPLPTHPVTHAAQPPAKIIHCEPVQQGVLDSKTKIVVVRTGQKQHLKACKPLFKGVQSVSVDEGEDTSDDRFFSAAEERTSPQTDSADKSISEDEPDTENLDTADDKEDHDSSDDSLEDLISLSAPLLSSQTPGSSSVFQPGTPGAPKLGGQSNGPGTPGSVFSNYTSMTARPSGMEGRLFKAQGLSQRIPEDFIHPKPSADEDEEVRVYVEVTALAKLGCFSGDWVRIEGSTEQQTDGLGSWGMAFHHIEEGLNGWRVAKIYSIPEMYSDRRRPYHLVPKRKDHHFTNGTKAMNPVPSVHLSPVLLANMDSPKYLRVFRMHSTPNAKTTNSSRSKAGRPSNHVNPPSAKEVTLLKVSTPLSTDRALQPAIFAALKHYFEQKRRIVKTGDLLAVAVDESLGRTLYQASGEETETIITNLWQDSTLENSTSLKGIVWFKIGQVIAEKTEANEVEQESELWAGLATIEPTGTRMVQAGSEKLRVPRAMESTWPYYSGAKRRLHNEHSKVLGQSKSSPIPETRRRLRELIAAATTPRAIHLGLKPIAILLTSAQRNIGKATIAEQSCTDLGMHIFSMDAYDILSEGGAGGDVKTEAFFKARCERAISCGPESCALLIRHVDALAADRMAGALKDILEESRVLIATTTEIEKVPDSLRGLFTHEIEISAPDESERKSILQSAVDNKGLVLDSGVDLSSVALKTAALVAGDLSDVVDRAAVAHQSRLERIVFSTMDHENFGLLGIRDIQISGGPTIEAITKADFDVAVDAGRKNFADSIGAPKIPNVSWDDVGGLTTVKDAVMETIQLPLERPELFAKGMKKRSGILFYGPPGTGKTLLAKAIATEFSLNFFSVKGPELLNMYIGESEANVRRVFQRARDARPCVVFFDELDSVAPKRGNQGDSGGVMDRIVSQLLAELDGMSNGDDTGGGVFVIGATNRPDLLDAALLRPGRFDKMLYLGVSDTHKKQETILEALTRK
jgi:peroxin-6